MEFYQPGILQPLPEQAVYLTCNLGQSANLQEVTGILQLLDTDNIVVAIGQSVLDALEHQVAGGTDVCRIWKFIRRFRGPAESHDRGR